jgi:hypothetical protein
MKKCPYCNENLDQTILVVKSDIVGSEPFWVSEVDFQYYKVVKGKYHGCFVEKKYCTVLKTLNWEKIHEAYTITQGAI